MGILSRRAVLTGASGIVGLGLAGTGLSVVACSSTDTASLRAAFAVALADVFRPERIGPAFRASEAGQDLAAAFDARPDLLAATRISCPVMRRDQLAEAIRRDFRNGDIVVADRVVVSRTECLIAATYA